MNYLAEIREFYNWLERNPLTASSICLWFALMHIANKTGWAAWFTVPVATLELKTGLSRREVYRQRNKLKQVGLIDFKERGGNQCAEYHLISLVCHTDTQSVTQPVTQVDTINKPNQTKPKESVKRFAPPTLDEVREYCDERGNSVDPQRFIDFYASKGWKVGNQPMKDWEAAVRTWEQREAKTEPPIYRKLERMW